MKDVMRNEPKPAKAVKEKQRAMQTPPIVSPQEWQAAREQLLVKEKAMTRAVVVEEKLKKLRAPTLIAWATDDIYFDIKWSHWLEKTIPGTRKRVELKSARIFFPEERASEFNKELKAHWANSSVAH